MTAFTTMFTGAFHRTTNGSLPENGEMASWIAVKAPKALSATRTGPACNDKLAASAASTQT